MSRQTQGREDGRAKRGKRSVNGGGGVGPVAPLGGSGGGGQHGQVRMVFRVHRLAMKRPYTVTKVDRMPPSRDREVRSYVPLGQTSCPSIKPR